MCESFLSNAHNVRVPGKNGCVWIVIAAFVACKCRRVDVLSELSRTPVRNFDRKGYSSGQNVRSRRQQSFELLKELIQLLRANGVVAGSLRAGADPHLVLTHQCDQLHLWVNAFDALHGFLQLIQTGMC